jgi:hypothetical protein
MHGNFAGGSVRLDKAVRIKKTASRRPQRDLRAAGDPMPADRGARRDFSPSPWRR